MSKSFSDFRKNWKLKRNFLLINDATRKYINPWLLPAIYLLNVVTNLSGDSNFPTAIVWIICIILCFNRIWDLLPYLKTIKKERRILFLNFILMGGLLISMIINAIIK